MKSRPIAIAGLVAVGVAAFFSFLSLRENSRTSSTSPAMPGMALELSPDEPAASPGDRSPADVEKGPASEPIAWSRLRGRLDGLADRLTLVPVQREANRLVQHWLRVDRHAALAWLSGHRGDPRFDPVGSSVGQSLVALGDFGAAQNLADGIVDPAVSDWVHQEAWAVAYEQGRVTAEQIKSSGLPARSIGSILSGSHRD